MKGMICMLYDIVLIEKPACDGITITEIESLYSMLKNIEAYPIELEAKEHECSAMGFLTPEAAEILDYDYNDLRDFVASILDDMQKENENHQYSFKNLQIYLCR